jgi:hypothetical protein
MVTVDGGLVYPVMISLSGRPIVRLFRHKVKYIDPDFKYLIKPILDSYTHDSYHYSPNRDYSAALFVCSQLTERGFSCTINISR